jgi:hypothetical protein
MRRPLTDKQMLAAARRRLEEHLQLRPATSGEAADLADSHRLRAAALEAEAAAILEEARMPTTTQLLAASGYGSGAELMAAGASLDGARELWRARWVEAREKAARARHFALRHRLEADAWARVAAGPEGSAYAATLAHLEARVAFYAARMELAS